MLSTHQTNAFEQLRRAAVERAMWLPQDASEELKRAKAGRSLFRLLLDELTKSAKEVATARNASENNFAYDLLPEAVGIVEDVRLALVREPCAGDLKTSWNFWKHEEKPFTRIQQKDTPHIDRSSLEAAAARYLASPFRTTSVDRVLVDALVATEIFAFGNDMWNPYLPYLSPITQTHALWAYMKRQFWNAITFGIIVALAGWLYTKSIISGTAFGWTVGIVFSISVLLFVLATLFLPTRWWRQAKAKRTVSDALSSMISVYAELRTDGAVSAEHIRTRAQKATEGGVLWPATLFALLDDIVRRTGRF